MIDKSDITELMHMTRSNLVNTGIGLFPDNFTIKPSKLHYKLSEALVCSERSTAIALPRGFGKSTYAWEVMASWNILHRRYRYVMFIGATTTIAEDMFSNVRASITSHPILSSCLENIRQTKNKFFYTIDGVRYFMACYGAGQQLRGKRFEEQRPDLVIMDDLETTEGTRSPDQRKKLKDWFFADVLPLDVNARYFFIGTFLHEDCLLANIIENPPVENRTKKPWMTFRFGVLDYETGDPTWPEKYDEDWVTIERKKYISEGMLYRFNTEYMNIAVDKRDRALDPERVRFYNPNQLRTMLNGGADIIIIVDPGINPDGAHDPSVILTTAMDTVGDMWILDIVRRHMVHHEILDAIIDAYKVWNPRQVFIEAVQAQQYLVQDLNHGTWPGGVIINVEPIDGKQVRIGKNRIYALEGTFEHRKILAPANATWWIDFCDELVSFPRGKHDDQLDALAYAKLNHIAPGAYKIDYEAIMKRVSPTVF